MGLESDMEWYDSGACAEYEEFFFPVGGTNETSHQRALREEKAIEVCGRCGVREQCVIYAFGEEDLDGTWAGFTKEERVEIKQRVDEGSLDLDKLRSMPFETTRQLVAVISKEPPRRRFRPVSEPDDEPDSAYPSELAPEQWEVLRPLFKLPKPKTGGIAPHPSARIIEGYLYKLRTGCDWREMPRHFPSNPTISRRVKQWREAGLLDILLHAAEERWVTQDIGISTFAKQHNMPAHSIYNLARRLHMVLPVELPTTEREDPLPLLPPSYRQELEAELGRRVHELARDNEHRLLDIASSLGISYEMALHRLQADGVVRSELALRLFEEGHPVALAVTDEHIERLNTIIEAERMEESADNEGMTAVEIHETYGLDRSLISFIKHDLNLSPEKRRQEDTNIKEEVFSAQEVERILNHPRGIKARTPKAPDHVRSLSVAIQLLNMGRPALRKWLAKLEIETEDYMFGPTVAPSITLDDIETIRRHRDSQG